MVASVTIKLSTILFYILFLFTTLSFSSLASKCDPINKKILLDIKSHFNAPDETAFAYGWDTTVTQCCTWSGIKCNTNGHVVSLSLSLTSDTPHSIPSSIGYLLSLQSIQITQYGKLFGSIPYSFINLTHLRSIDFSGNNLNGPIPGHFHRLVELDLHINNFSGPIPASLWNITSLRFLNLAMNRFSGSIPSKLGQLTNLVHLDLFANQLSGSIPSTLGQLTKLSFLDLSLNHLSGSIPPSLSRLANITMLDLRANQLTGSVPSSFGSFNNPSLILFLSSNNLSDPIPKSFGQANVSLLDLSSNQLTGDASFLFRKDKTAMKTVFLYYNEFEFDFSKVEFPHSLRVLDIRGNKIYGSLPKQLGQLPLQFIDVSYNQLCGPIPTGGRMKKFNPDNFGHNKCLCGVPLPPCK